MKWFIKKYMAQNHINNFNELSKATGIKLRTLMRRVSEPSTLLLYEVQALDDALHFTDEDMLRLVNCEFDK